MSIDEITISVTIAHQPSVIIEQKNALVSIGDVFNQENLQHYM